MVFENSNLESKNMGVGTFVPLDFKKSSFISVYFLPYLNKENPLSYKAYGKNISVFT